jgi:hypothetical protein
MNTRLSYLLVASLSFVLAVAPVTVSAAGTIEGAIAFWGDPAGGTHVEIAAHSNPDGPPDASVMAAVPADTFSLAVDDGTYYIAAVMSPDGVFGQPRPEDVLVWYDADGDGDRDSVTVNGGTVTGIDIDMGRVYVDVDASGAGDGSSWSDAFTDLQDGIDLAVSGVEVWVAEGTYVPGTSRGDSFTPKAGVRVYGGFEGTETSRLLRDWIAHPTVLSGEIGSPAATDNCYHVVRADNANTTAMLNGFTVTRGYANGAGDDGHGGAVRAVGGGVSLLNLSVVDNYAGFFGGGVYSASPGTLYIVNCRFRDNQAVMHGGGAHIDAASGVASMLVNAVFTGNTAFRGGGIAVEGQVFAPGLQPRLVNLSLANNSAGVGGEGGGIFTNTTTYSPPGGAPVDIENCVLWDNTGTNPQITAFGGSDPPVVDSSLVQGGWAGPGSHILTVDPSFADDELRIAPDSPVIDAGDSTALPYDLVDLDEDHWTDDLIPKDLDGNWRREDVPSVPDTGVPDGDGRTVDMGAYESTVLFSDDFESGDTSEWSAVVGEL